MSHGSVAKSVRLQKEKHPDLYCSDSRCLYRTGGGDCPKHFRVQLQDGILRIAYRNRLIEVAKICATLARIHSETVSVETMKVYLGEK